MSQREKVSDAIESFESGNKSFLSFENFNRANVSSMDEKL